MNAPLHSRAAVLGSMFLCTLLSICGFGCGGKGPKTKTNIAPIDPKIAALVVTSTAFKNGDPIPAKYTADGENMSPPLAWTKVPYGTKEFLIVCEDLDSQTVEPKNHWFACNISPDVTDLQEHFPAGEFVSTPNGYIYQTRNEWGRKGYFGPDPPKGSGVHHYRFQVRALKVPLRIPSDPTPGVAEILNMTAGHVIGQGELIGTYER